MTTVESGQQQQYDPSTSLPFYQENDRTWHCKFCSYVPHQFRDSQSIWTTPGGGPPPNSFIEQHLSMCRVYQQQQQQQYQQNISMFPSAQASFGRAHYGNHPSSYGMQPHGPPPGGSWEATTTHNSQYSSAGLLPSQHHESNYLYGHSQSLTPGIMERSMGGRFLGQSDHGSGSPDGPQGIGSSGSSRNVSGRTASALGSAKMPPFESLLKQLAESNKILTKKVEALGTFAVSTRKTKSTASSSSSPSVVVITTKQVLQHQRQSDAWMVMFKKLREYRIMNGDSNVSQLDKDTRKLGLWVRKQRVNYRNLQTGKGQKITPERIIMLESLDLRWHCHAPQASWDENFVQLQHFHRQMGSCNVPFNATNPNQLAKWMAFQRTEYKRWKEGLDTLLTLDHFKSLNDIGVDWKGPRL